MSNLQKNHVKIDVFKEPKYHFDPNQVRSTSFRAHKTPNKQKNSAFVTFFFGRNASAASIVIMEFLHGARTIDSGAEVHKPASVCFGFSDTTPPSDYLFLFLWYVFFLWHFNIYWNICIE